MEYVLKPFARANGIKSKKGLVRFAEQGWMFLYYAASWCLGMVRCSKSGHVMRASIDKRHSILCTSPDTGSTFVQCG